MPVQPEGINYFSLGSGDIFQPQHDTVTWVQIQQGCVNWMGFEELPLLPLSGILPLDSKMWLQATDEVELSSEDISAIQDADTLADSLTLLATYFLDYIQLLEQQEISAELRRFQERERLNYQVMKETLGELSSVLQQRKTVFYPAVTPTSDPDEALLIAAGAVGRALGVTIRPLLSRKILQEFKTP